MHGGRKTKAFLENKMWLYSGERTRKENMCFWNVICCVSLISQTFLLSRSIKLWKSKFLFLRFDLRCFFAFFNSQQQQLWFHTKQILFNPEENLTVDNDALKGPIDGKGVVSRKCLSASKNERHISNICKCLPERSRRSCDDANRTIIDTRVCCLKGQTH